MNAELTLPLDRSTPMKFTAGIFAAALFVSAALLFWVQPLIAKMLLPLLGGAPSVWNTCMLFFQTLLLAGYAYALFVSQRLRLRNQALLHVALLLAAGSFLPFAISKGLLSSLPTQNNPTPWLLGVLLATVGPPFFVLSATAPLLQRWFSYSNHNSAKDPYFLYAVSNAGSMLSLLAFPFILEPRLEIRHQTVLWAMGYVALAALISCCAIALRKRGRSHSVSTTLEKDAETLTIRRRLYWLVAAFIPSSLMLGVTTYISTDVASVPLIWVIPLTIYLLTFILAFANVQVINLRLASLLLPALVICLAFVSMVKPIRAVWAIIGLHLLVFFIAALVCHRRLALDRPAVSRLPDYFLWIALGGVLGGIFNALLAPFVFSTPVEYPLVIIVACMMAQASGKEGPKSRAIIAFPFFVLLVTIGLSLLASRYYPSTALQSAFVLGIPLLLCYFAVSRRPVVFALSLLAVWVGVGYFNVNENVLVRKRNFFGIWQVTSESADRFHRLMHGSTTHGGQFLDGVRKCDATAYFHKSGPLGQIFDAYNAKPTSPTVAVTGLGAGTIATYSLPGQHWDFYEIDPVVVRLASDPTYFTYLSDCSKAPYRVVLGDARLRLQEAPAHAYGLIILDAFSSDSVPAHLLTVQAINLYLSKLADGGLIAFNASNRYLDLEPLLSGLSKQAQVSAFIRQDPEYDLAARKYISTWVVMGRNDPELGDIPNDPRWRRLKGDVIWTDDFSNILDLMK